MEAAVVEVATVVAVVPSPLLLLLLLPSSLRALFDDAEEGPLLKLPSELLPP